MKNSKLPPYISVSGFESALKILKNFKKGKVVTSGEMRKARLQRNVRYQAIGALKFFGILDKDKKITDKKDIFLSKDMAKIQQIVKQKYAPLLKMLKAPADRKAIIDSMKKVYRCGSTVAPLAATFFSWATEMAGMNVVTEGSRRRGPRKRLGKKKAKRGRPRTTRIPSSPQIVYTFNFQIAPKTTKSQVEKMIKNVEEAVKG